MNPAVAARSQQLAQVFEVIGRTRMAGIPILHPGLAVEAIGFAPFDASGNSALGILLTPWFMNLIWLPLTVTEVTQRQGETTVREIGGERFEFIGAEETQFGAYELCSLFSPMFEFPDHATARATAQEVLDTLRRTPAAPAPLLDRRAFLFGRGPAGAQP
jgi:[NiFe] hydrogenase assembly HybE family chaperone